MESLEERIERLEKQVANLQRHLGIDPALADPRDPPLPPAFYQALGLGKQITAIKIYREATGASLRDAKSAVDAMMGRRQIR